MHSCESSYSCVEIHCADFQVREYQGSFASYRYLWTDDRFEVYGSVVYITSSNCLEERVKKLKHSKQIASFLIFRRSEFMRQFLLYGHVLSTEEAELYADYELKKNPPTLDNFKEQVCFTIDLTIIYSICGETIVSGLIHCGSYI